MTVELTQGTVGQPAVYTAEARETSSQLEAIQLIDLSWSFPQEPRLCSHWTGYQSLEYVVVIV